MLVDGMLYHGPWAIPACAAHRMLVDDRGWDALPWTMSDSYLCSAHDARVCVWIGCSTMGPCATPTCEAHRVLVDARGRGALTCTHERSPPAQRAGCSRMLVDGVL